MNCSPPFRTSSCKICISFCLTRMFAVGPLGLMLVAVLWPAGSWAGELEDAQAVQAGAEGLRQAARFPWYDADADGLRPVQLPTYQPPPQSSNWQWQPTNRRRGNWQWLWRLLEYVVWGVLAFALFLLLFVLLRNLSQRLPKQGVGAADRERGQTEADQIEKLPFQVRRPQTDLLGEARRHYQLGHYGEAIIYLFSYQLVRLDKSQLIRLAKGKTNRQYLGELQSGSPLKRMLAQSMSTFEDVFFGNYGLSRERFEACWNRLDEFHQLVQQPSETT